MLKYRFMYHRHNLTSSRYVLTPNHVLQKTIIWITLPPESWNCTGILYINARMKVLLENRCRGKTMKSLYIFENRQTQAGQENSQQDRPVNLYIFRRLLTVSTSERHSEPFSKVGLGKTVRGQKPNPLQQGHPPQSF